MIAYSITVSGTGRTVARSAGITKSGDIVQLTEFEKLMSETEAEADWLIAEKCDEIGRFIARDREKK